MHRFFILLCLVMLLTACSNPGTVAETWNVDTAGEQSGLRLADVDFILVPGDVFYVLTEEKLNDRQNILERRYVRFDGIWMRVSDVVAELELSHRVNSVREAREYLLSASADLLELYPQTYISPGILHQWEQDGYDGDKEKNTAVLLEQLKKRCAVSRLNEVFIIRQKPDDVAGAISRLERDSLPEHPDLQVSRSLETLGDGVDYRADFTIGQTLQDKPFDTGGGASVLLRYRVDELGNPHELLLEVSYKRKTPFQPTANQVALFIQAWRDTVTRELALYGVSENNPSLAYANLTLCYESTEEDGVHTERIVVR